MGTNRKLKAGFFGTLGLAAGLLTTGCFGRTMDGQWRGELPGFGKDCRILFDGGSRVSAACQDLPHRSGLGKYRLDGQVLALEWMTVAEGGRTMPNSESFLRLQIAGSGNEIVLTPAGGGSSFAWRRAAR